MTDPKPAIADIEQLPDDEESVSLACVLSFNANDPSGAGGLGCDAVAMASVGAGMCVKRAKMGQFRVRAGGWSAPVLCFT